MADLTIASIVEGHAETRSIGVLLRRLRPTVRVLPPQRVPRSRLLRAGEIERAVELAARKAGPGGAILVLMDADDDCPAALGPSLLARCRSAHAAVSTRVVLAKRELESWFLAGIESLRGRRTLAIDAASVPDPETAPRNAKGFLSRVMARPYQDVIDQVAFAAQLDLELARRHAPSLDKFLRDVASLL
jgi:hypothetical protein